MCWAWVGDLIASDRVRPAKPEAAVAFRGWDAVDLARALRLSATNVSFRARGQADLPRSPRYGAPAASVKHASTLGLAVCLVRRSRSGRRAPRLYRGAPSRLKLSTTLSPLKVG
jgi:hypothetical protein